MQVSWSVVRLGAVAALVAALSWQPDDAAAEPGVWARQAMEDHGLGSCAELLEFLEPHVASGDAGALVLLGLLSETGDCMPLDHGRTAEFYRQAWDAGYDLAGARLHLLGLGVPEDRDRARELFRQAALRTTVHFERFERLRTEVFRDSSVPPEMEAAIRWARRLEAMDAEAQLALARRSRADASRPRNRDIAYHFARLAGQQGLAEASTAAGFSWTRPPMKMSRAPSASSKALPFIVIWTPGSRWSGATSSTLASVSTAPLAPRLICGQPTAKAPT